MTKGIDHRKLTEWTKRLARYRASGSTVARFCKLEDVSVASFYYWTKRIEQLKPELLKVADGKRIVETGQRTDRSENSPGGDVVQFWFDDGLRVSVPAHCSDAIRGLLEWSRATGAFQHSSEREAESAPGAFQQLVVATR